MILHPNVTLAQGVKVPAMAWILHSQILTRGVPNHRVIVTGFPIKGAGLLGISVQICPLDATLPLRFRES